MRYRPTVNQQAVLAAVCCTLCTVSGRITNTFWHISDYLVVVKIIYGCSSEDGIYETKQIDSWSWKSRNVSTNVALVFVVVVR